MTRRQRIACAVVAAALIAWPAAELVTFTPLDRIVGEAGSTILTYLDLYPRY